MKSQKSIVGILLLGIAMIAVISAAGCINSETPAYSTHSEFTKVADHFYEVTYYDYDDSARRPMLKF